MNIRNTALVAALLSAVVITAPAPAQVSGIATAETSVAIANSKALGTAYQQIAGQYAATFQQILTKSQEINKLNVQLDINKDKELTQAELDVAIKAKSPLLVQRDAKQKEIDALQGPIILAQLFSVEQVALKYNTAQEAVIAEKKINILLAPSAIIAAADVIDVTSAITAQLDKIVPSVAMVPPAGWRASRQIFALYQQIQQAQQIQAAQAAAAQPPAATSADQPESR
jgi:Skp family chaperone for outer membrane proteins